MQHLVRLSEPTHDAGHTLDLVISRRDVQVTDVFVGDMISDHALIHFKVQSLKPSAADVQTVTSRAWRRLSRDAFAADLMETRLCSDMDVLRDMSADDLVSLYCDVMTCLLYTSDAADE